MLEKGSFWGQFPELEQEDLHNLIPSITQGMEEALEYNKLARLFLKRVYDPQLGVREEPVFGGSGGYSVTNSASLNQVEISINREYYGNRWFLNDESIRLKFSNPSLGPDKVTLEYSRSLRGGGIRTFTNNVMAFRMAARFVRQMQEDFGQGQ